MIKLQRTYVMLVALSLVFAGCDKFIYDQQESEGGADHKVHLSVNVRAAQPKSGLRAADPSINTDATYYEDNVYDLAMLIFNSDEKGERVGIVHLNNNLGSGISTRAFQVELTAGKKYDFYFVANMPDMRDDLTEANIPNRKKMDDYLQSVNGVTRELSDALYHGASDTEAFPMARVYLKQEITEGGTIYQPKPFYPKQHGNEEYTVVANSDGAGDVTREYVELIRVVAKFELVLDETTEAIVDKVSFRNANRHFRLVEFEDAPDEYFNDATKTVLGKTQDADTRKYHYIFYMPEATIGTTKWHAAAIPDHAPINYFTINTRDGRKYDVPVITYNNPIAKENYLEFATGESAKELYSIYRNRHYRYEVTIQQKIEILYDIDPWNVVKRAFYMGYGYNVEIDPEGNIKITNTIDDCMPHLVELEAKNGAKIQLKDSEGNPIGSELDKVTYGYSSESDFEDEDEDKLKMKTGYSEGFKLNNIPAFGDYLEVHYNGIHVKTFSK